MSSPTQGVEESSSSRTGGNSSTGPPQCPPFDATPTGSLTGVLTGTKPHPEFWFNDGNLILVDAANRTTAFRIYAGLLASQSEFFANMFTVASSNADEVYDGCPVVPVYDTPEDFAHLLRVLIPKDSRK